MDLVTPPSAEALSTIQCSLSITSAILFFSLSSNPASSARTGRTYAAERACHAALLGARATASTSIPSGNCSARARFRVASRWARLSGGAFSRSSHNRITSNSSSDSTPTGRGSGNDRRGCGLKPSEYRTGSTARAQAR
jgi:type II secretory pathway pseudopilin PulG